MQRLLIIEPFKKNINKSQIEILLKSKGVLGVVGK
jgi:hypothetical protein